MCPLSRRRRAVFLPVCSPLTTGIFFTSLHLQTPGTFAESITCCPQFVAMGQTLSEPVVEKVRSSPPFAPPSPCARCCIAGHARNASCLMPSFLIPPTSRRPHVSLALTAEPWPIRQSSSSRPLRLHCTSSPSSYLPRPAPALGSPVPPPKNRPCLEGLRVIARPCPEPSSPRRRFICAQNSLLPYCCQEKRNHC